MINYSNCGELRSRMRCRLRVIESGIIALESDTTNAKLVETAGTCEAVSTKDFFYLPVEMPEGCGFATWASLSQLSASTPPRPAI
jgi:hypothetical protein